MNLINKYGKKKVSIIVGVVIILAIIGGTGMWYVNEQNHKKEVLASINLTFKEDSFIEYGQDKVDYNEYIKEIIGEPEVSLPTDEIDTKVINKYDLTYNLSKEGCSKDVKLTLVVKDTKAPEIKLKEETVTLEYGSEYDIKENIDSVIDPIDGDIPYAETVGESNYYIVEGAVDTSTEGDYTITVKALDRNKTASEKTYAIHVNEEQVEEPTPQQPSGADYSAPVNNGDGGSYTPPNKSSGNGSNGESSPPPQTCTANGQWQMLSNSGVAYYTWDKADSYGYDQIYKEGGQWYMYGYKVFTTKDICGNTGYTVKFY